MRIAFVLSHPASSIGAEVREVALASMLRRLGIDAQVFRPTRDGSRVEDHSIGAPVSYCQIDDQQSSDDLASSSKLLADLKWFRPNVIVLKGFGYRLNVEIASLLGTEINAKLIAILGGRWRDNALKLCDAVLYEFRSQREQFADFTEFAQIHAVLPKYINWIHILNRSNLKGVRDFDLACVGSLIERKRVHLLSDVPADFRVALIGDGPLKQSLQETFSKKPNIEFLGSLDNEQVLDTLQRSKFLVHFAEDEGLPRVFGESLACGTPIVCSDKLKCGAEFPERFLTLVKSDSIIATSIDLLKSSVIHDKIRQECYSHMVETHKFKTISDIFLNAIASLDDRFRTWVL